MILVISEEEKKREPKRIHLARVTVNFQSAGGDAAACFLFKSHLQRVGGQEVIPAEVLLTPRSSLLGLLPALVDQHTRQLTGDRVTHGELQVSDERGVRTWKALTMVRWSLLEFLDRVFLLMSATFSLPCKRRGELHQCVFL